LPYPGEGNSCATVTTSTTAWNKLHAAGWSVGDTAFVTEAGTLIWLVSGVDGEDVIRAEGPTQAAAWRTACDQARAVGMLKRWRVSQPGVG
jgi:hypothetical protein